MPIFTSKYFDGHEDVYFLTDDSTGLKAIIAIHCTLLGNPLGGTRYSYYSNEQDAIDDALSLSRAMTYKAAISGLNLGGGKGVIIADSTKKPSPEILRSYAQRLDLLPKPLKTAGDVGISPAENSIMAETSSSVINLPEGAKYTGVYNTAYGVFQGMRAALEVVKGTPDFNGVKVAVQGLGNVGYLLVEILVDQGAVIIGCNPSEEKADKARDQLGIKIVPIDDIYVQDVDIFAPCALGGIINERTLPLIKAPIIAGCANNQLAGKEIAQQLRERNILYAPDYVINAGGLITYGLQTGASINGVALAPGYNNSTILAEVSKIYDTCMEIFKKSIDLDLETNVVADKIVEKRLELAKKD